MLPSLWRGARDELEFPTWPGEALAPHNIPTCQKKKLWLPPAFWEHLLRSTQQRKKTEDQERLTPDSAEKAREAEVCKERQPQRDWQVLGKLEKVRG